MTDREIDNLAIQRGFKTGELKKLVRRGYADASAGNKRVTTFVGGPKATQAYNAGFELFAEQKRPRLEPGEHKIRIGKADKTVILNRGPGGEGWEVTVPMPGRVGGTSVVAGDTPELALAAARKRLTEAEAEFAKDPIAAVFDRDATVDGKNYGVHVTRHKSGKLHMAAIAYDELRWDGRDEEVGLREMGAKIAARIARTVDGVPGDVKTGKRTPPPQLPIRGASECAKEVHRCMTELAQRERTEETAKTARKAAEAALASANVALLDAVDRENAPKQTTLAGVP